MTAMFVAQADRPADHAVRRAPFLALTLGSLVVAGIAGLPVADAIESFSKGFGDTAAGVGTLIALGVMFDKLLAGSRGRRPDRRHDPAPVR